MSLILEALNKAEQSHGATVSYNATQAYQAEKRTTPKWMLLILIATVCATSAIITSLIFYKLNSNNEPSHLETRITQPPTETDSVEHQQAAQDQHLAGITREPINPTAQTHSDKKPHQTILSSKEKDNLIQHRDPSLQHLVKSSSHSEKAEFRSSKNKRLSSTSSHKETVAVKEPGPYMATSNQLDVQKTEDKPKVSNISSISNTPLADIKISVHMYSEIPAKRFVYINSTRYSEGSMVGNNIFLDEITENGVILNNNGTFYRLPIKL